MPQCPKCSKEIPIADVNVAEGVAVCRACGAVTALSLIAEQSDPQRTVPTTFDPASPPPGVRYTDDGREAVLVARFSIAFPLFIIPFATIWCTVTTTVVISSINTGRPPIWFCIPFMFVGVLLLSAAFFFLLGRVRVRLSDQSGEVFTGVGLLGRRRTFQPAQVTAVRLVESTARTNGRPVLEILIDGPTPVRFGMSLPEARRKYVAAALRSQLGV